MGFLTQKGITSLGGNKTASSGGLLQQKGITSLSQPTKPVVTPTPTKKVSSTKVVTNTKPAVKAASPPKQTVKIEPSKNFDIKKIGSAIVAGTKTLPGMTKQAGGIILQNIIQTSKFADNFFKPLNKINNLILPKKIEESRAKQEQIKQVGLKNVEKKALAIRESGQKSQIKVLQDYSKKQTPSKGIQGYLEMAAFNLPQMAGTVALTVGTALVTRNPVAATSVGLSTTYGMGASEVYSEARKNGLSDKQALPLAQAGGFLIGALDYIPLARFVRKSGAIETVKKSIIKKVASQVVSIGTQAGFEGITEAGQEIIGNAIAKTYDEHRDLFQNVKEAGIVGAMLGGVGDVTVSGAIGATKGKNSSPEQLISDIEDKIDIAFKTPANKRTAEQTTIVASLLTEEVTPGEAISKIGDSDLKNTEAGKKIVIAALEAQKEGKNIKIALSDDQKSVDIDIVSPEESIEAISEQAGGWKSGDKVKFDTALFKKDQKALTELLPTAPPDYKSRFQSEINAILGREMTQEEIDVNESLLTSDQANEEETKATPKTEEISKKLKSMQEDITLRRGENDSKKSILDQFPPRAIQAMRAMKISMNKRINKGMDAETVMETKSYKDHIWDVMAAIGTDSESEALRYINEDLPEPLTRATSREELNQIKVLKSHLKPKEVGVSKTQLPVGEGKPQVSKLESRMKGVLKNATPEQIEELGLSTYNRMNKKETIEKAAQYVSENQQEALDVLRGKKNAPDGIIPEAIYIALTAQAKGDITLATKLASLQATALGQRISILSELDKDSPVKLLNEIYKIREEEFIKRNKGKKPSEVKRSIVREIQKKVPVANKYDWNSFINSIEC